MTPFPDYNDDDNANGIIDLTESTASTSDDEVEQLALTIPTTYNESGLVRLTLNGPLAAYDASGVRLVAQDGVITWMLAAGQTPPQQVLIAATGGVTQINGASVQLMVTDDGGPQTRTTTTTPVNLDLSHTSPSHTGKAATDVLVGERVTVSAQTVAPDGWAGEVTWDVTGTRYKSYQAALNSATLDPLPQAPTGNSVDFFWSDAANGLTREGDGERHNQRPIDFTRDQVRGIRADGDAGTAGDAGSNGYGHPQEPHN